MALDYFGNPWSQATIEDGTHQFGFKINYNNSKYKYVYSIKLIVYGVLAGGAPAIGGGLIQDENRTGLTEGGIAR
jgi:hypothetical protein